MNIYITRSWRWSWLSPAPHSCTRCRRPWCPDEPGHSRRVNTVIVIVVISTEPSRSGLRSSLQWGTLGICPCLNINEINYLNLLARGWMRTWRCWGHRRGWPDRTPPAYLSCVPWQRGTRGSWYPARWLPTVDNCAAPSWRSRRRCSWWRLAPGPAPWRSPAARTRPAPAPWRGGARPTRAATGTPRARPPGQMYQYHASHVSSVSVWPLWRAARAGGGPGRRPGAWSHAPAAAGRAAWWAAGSSSAAGPHTTLQRALQTVQAAAAAPASWFLVHWNLNTMWVNIGMMKQVSESIIVLLSQSKLRWLV